MFAELQAVHPVLASTDVAESVQFFSRLGFALDFQDAPIDPKYAAIHRGGVELHIQWASPDQWVKGIDRPVYRIMVSDVDELFVEFQNAGVFDKASDHRSPWVRPANTPWGTREFHIRDPGMNGLHFYRPQPAAGR